MGLTIAAISQGIFNSTEALSIHHSPLTSAPAAHHSGLLQDSYIGKLHAARLALQSENLPLAQRYYNESVALEPGNVIALYNLALIYTEQAERSGSITEKHRLFGLAEQSLLKLHSIHPDLAGTYFLLGRIDLLRDDAKKAVEHYKLGLMYLPENGFLHFNLATVLDHLNEKEKALSEYQAAVTYEPGYAPAHNNMGLILEQLQQPEAAELAYRKAITANPEYTFARLNLGNLYQQQNQLQKALQAFTEATQKDPKNYWAHLYVGNLLFQLSEYPGAAVAYSTASQINPDDGAAFYLLAVTLHRVNRLNEAQTACLNYMAHNPQGSYRSDVIRLLEVIEYQRQLGNAPYNAQLQTIQAKYP